MSEASYPPFVYPGFEILLVKCIKRLKPLRVVP